MTGKHAAPPAPADPADVIRAALVEPSPCPHCGRTVPCRCMPDPKARLDWRVNLLLERLAGAGLLHLPAPAPRPATQDDIDETARWLAVQSRHPRYTQVADGWKQLLASPGNVEHAHAAAVKANSPAPQQTLADLAAAKGLLIGWHETRRAEQSRGV